MQDHTKPYIVELFQVRSRTTFNESRIPPTWRRSADCDTLEECHAHITKEKEHVRKLQGFVNLGRTEWLIQRRTHTVHEVIPVT